MDKRETSQPFTASLVSSLLGNCLCDPLELAETRGWSPATMFVEIHGIRFIGLGAMMDELTPHQRVYDTLEQLTTRTERLISIGYLVEGHVTATAEQTKEESPEVQKKAAEAVPLDVWNKSYSGEKRMSSEVKQAVELIKAKQYKQAISMFKRQLNTQRAFPLRGNNMFQSGITAHNLAVASVLSGDSKSALTMFREAITLKERAFGSNHVELALSWEELGVQKFAKSDFEEALAAFREAHSIRSKHPEYTKHPSMSMVLNNMACCNFQMRNHRTALLQLEEARQIQQEISGSTARADLDLLHVATVMCNCGYLYICLKEYEKATSLLEEALLVQQSVLDESHRAIRDTRANLEFANAFHS